MFLAFVLVSVGYAILNVLKEKRLVSRTYFSK